MKSPIYVIDIGVYVSACHVFHAVFLRRLFFGPVETFSSETGKRNKRRHNHNHHCANLMSYVSEECFKSNLLTLRHTLEPQ
jgi:hypothetical protein